MDELTRLAQAARLGDRGALRGFVDASYPEIWRLCAALVDMDAADDLAQETVLRLMQALRRYRAESSARVWSLAIARRVCMDELRVRHRRRRGQLRLLNSTPREDGLAPDPAGDVSTQQLLAALDPDRRAAFALTQLFRLTYEEAATVCDCPPGTIRSRVARARADLIALMGHSEARSSEAQGR